MNTYFIQENDPTEEVIDAMSIEELEEFLEGEESLFDWDGDALASAGFGTDEDYGGFSDEW